MSKWVWLLVLAISGSLGCLAQDEQDENTLELEQWAEQQEREPELDEFQFLREQIRRRGILISEWQPEHMRELGLSPVQIQSYMWYVTQFGLPENQYELQAIPYWDHAIIKKIVPFIRFMEHGLHNTIRSDWFSNGGHQLLIKSGQLLEKSRAYRSDSLGTKTYTGSPLRLFLRYNLQYDRKLSAGITMEKDAGEQFGQSLSRPADFTSFHWFMRGDKLVKQLALGDYAINLGQGLVAWQGMAFGKGSEGAGAFRQGAMLKPYRSASEFNYFRGAAIHLAKGKWESLHWLSVRKKSARLEFDGELPVAFTSFDESGNHRSLRELAGRKKVRETIVGTAVRWQGSKLKLGWNSMYQQFSLPWLPEEEFYNKYYFRGRQVFLQSIDYSLVWKQVFLFGEICRSMGEWAMVHGALVNLGTALDASIVYRYAHPGFHSYYANALTEQSAVRNEEGVYTNFQIRLHKQWKAQFYADFFRFPWLRFRVDAPSWGQEYRAVVQWEKRRQWQFYALFKTQSKSENQTGGIVNEPVATERRQLRIHVDRIWARSWQQSVRVERIWFQKGQTGSSGWGAYFDSKQQITARGMQISGRVQCFRTDAYATRIYAYERDLLYSYSVPAVYDHGWRYYLLLNGKLKPGGRDNLMAKNITVKWWARWSQTIYSNKNSSGSGWDEILGKRRSELKFQVVVEW